MLSNMIQSAISAEKNASELLNKAQQACQSTEKEYDNQARLLFQKAQDETRARLQEKIAQRESENSQKLAQSMDLLKKEESSFLENHAAEIEKASDAVCQILCTPLYIKRGDV